MVDGRLSNGGRAEEVVEVLGVDPSRIVTLAALAKARRCWLGDYR